MKKLYQPHFDEYSVSQFHDETGFEAFANSVHLRDYCGQEFLGVGLDYVHRVFDEFEISVPDRDLHASFSLFPEDAVVKFYVTRVGQDLLSGDLEGYGSAIMEFDKAGLAELT